MEEDSGLLEALASHHQGRLIENTDSMTINLVPLLTAWVVGVAGAASASPDLATDPQSRVAAAALVTSNLVGGPAGLAALLPASVSSRTSGQDPSSPPHNALTGNAGIWKYSALQTCKRCLM